MTKRCVGNAYGSEMVEKGVKMSRVGLLPGVSRTHVETHVRRQKPMYTGSSPHMQNLENIPTYTRIELHTHEYKLRT